MNCEYFSNCISMYKSKSCNEEYPYCKIRNDIIHRIKRSEPIDLDVLTQIDLNGFIPNRYEEVSGGLGI